MIIKLTPDVEQALAEAARNLGTTPEQLALDSLRERFVGREAPHPRLRNRRHLQTSCGDISAFCIAVNASLVAHACQKPVEKSSQQGCSHNSSNNGHDPHGYWALGGSFGCRRPVSCRLRRRRTTLAIRPIADNLGVFHRSHVSTWRCRWVSISSNTLAPLVSRAPRSARPDRCRSRPYGSADGEVSGHPQWTWQMLPWW
jgi:hypothetical protein